MGVRRLRRDVRGGLGADPLMVLSGGGRERAPLGPRGPAGHRGRNGSGAREFRRGVPEGAAAAAPSPRGHRPGTVTDLGPGDGPAPRTASTGPPPRPAGWAAARHGCTSNATRSAGAARLPLESITGTAGRRVGRCPTARRPSQSTALRPEPMACRLKTAHTPGRSPVENRPGPKCHASKKLGCGRRGPRTQGRD